MGKILKLPHVSMNRILAYFPRPTSCLRTGFTLIEILMVLVILLLAAGIVAPRILNSIGTQDLQMEARRVKSKIIYAQQGAITNQRNFRVVFDPVNDILEIKYSPQNNAIYNTIQTITLENGITIDTTNFSSEGAHIVRFDHFGSPSESGSVTLKAPDGTTQDINILPVTGKVEIP